MKKIFLVLVFMVFLLQITTVLSDDEFSTQTDDRSINYSLTPAEEAFLDTLQYRSFLYFINEVNPENGLVKDRSTDNSPASIAAVGFALPVWAIGSQRGWIARERAAQLTVNALRFFRHSEQSADALATGYQGFYYHFLDMETGERVWECELSTVDTAWLMSGIRFARQFYERDLSQEREIRALADSLTSSLNWDFFTRPDSILHPGTVSMGWRPEKGLTKMGWVGYNEALYLYVLAAGCGYENALPAYQRWLSHYQWREPYPGLAHVVFPPLFGHQYSHMFIDFRGMADNYMQAKALDYFENSRQAVYTQREYAIHNPGGWAGYDSLIWGLTACDGPGKTYNTEDRQFFSYAGRGTSGPGLVWSEDGTLAPTAAGGSIVFAPEIVIPTLQAMYDRYGKKGLWGPYGFYDAFNPTIDWFDSDYLGIDQGPIVIMIENFRSGLIWEYAMRDPVIQKGLKILNFKKLDD